MSNPPFFESFPTDFEVVRARDAYIPLLRACYALAQQLPVQFPPGYTSLSEIRADVRTLQVTVASAVSPAVQQALANDVRAVTAVPDPSAFGFIVREDSTGALLICLRGTQTPEEWLKNFTAIPRTLVLAPEFGLVHLGFQQMYEAIQASVLHGIDSLLAPRLTVLGHSLGGAIGLVCATDLQRNHGLQPDVCTVGGPRVGKRTFRDHFDVAVPRAFRVTNQFDVVPHLPSAVLGWNHVGTEIEVHGNVAHAHSLDAYLAGLNNIHLAREVDGENLLVLSRPLGMRVL